MAIETVLQLFLLLLYLLSPNFCLDQTLNKIFEEEKLTGRGGVEMVAHLGKHTV